MWKIISKIIFFICGWEVEGSVPPNLKNAIMVAAPHTSNWDFIFCRGAFYIMGVPLRFTIKKEWTKGIMGVLIRSIGAIAIDRKKNLGKKKESTVDLMADLFNEHEQLIVLVTPEGTRKYAKRWKTGFYRVAEKAEVPLLLGYLDYKRKKAGVGPVFYPTGDYDADLIKIKEFYKGITARHPELGVK